MRYFLERDGVDIGSKSFCLFFCLDCPAVNKMFFRIALNVFLSEESLVKIHGFKEVTECVDDVVFSISDNKERAHDA